MIRTLSMLAALAAISPTLAHAQASAAIASGKVSPSPLSPGEIVAAAQASEWVSIAPSDLLVMTLVPGAWEQPRRVVIQLIPPPFSAGWVGNVRKLAAAHWWDGLSVNRVQDNYVVQWGDADGEDPTKARALPAGLLTISESEYSVSKSNQMIVDGEASGWVQIPEPKVRIDNDPYANSVGFVDGWPIAQSAPQQARYWPVHCYGMVGVGRDLSPKTGTGAELYTVIGHAPRHLDRNIALVGRVIEGIEHLSSLPRGTGALGFYETPAERTGIVSVRLGSELADAPRFEYLSTESATFARYADARANRRDPFFIKPAGGADVCNIPVPVRRVKAPG